MSMSLLSLSKRKVMPTTGMMRNTISIIYPSWVVLLVPMSLVQAAPASEQHSPKQQHKASISIGINEIKNEYDDHCA